LHPHRRPSLGLGRRDADCLSCARSSQDRKSTRLNSSHVKISYAVFCLEKTIPGRLRYSPDAKFVTYLFSERGDLVRDLWRLDLPSGRKVFFNDTATTEIYALSLHDALPI